VEDKPASTITRPKNSNSASSKIKARNGAHRRVDVMSSKITTGNKTSAEDSAALLNHSGRRIERQKSGSVARRLSPSSNRRKAHFQIQVGGNMRNEGLQQLYIDELKDLYSAETQLVKALPKMAKAATSPDLKQGFEDHLEQTRGHVERLEEIFDSLDQNPKGKKCAGMEGLVKEGSEMLEQSFTGALMDAGIISAAQRVEHYEIAAYGTVCEFARILGHSDQESLLQQTLQEEKETDEKLTEIAKQTNQQANEQEPEERALRRGSRRAA